MHIKFLSRNGGETDSIEESIFGCKKYEDNRVWVCYSKDMSELAHEEAEHHDHDEENPHVVHQLHAWRNVYYHREIWRAMWTIPKGGVLLEIGAGSGFDAQHFIRDYHLVLTDVSPQTLNRLSTQLDSIQEVKLSEPLYVACDGEHLPFASAQFDAVYMVATFHHFEEYGRALAECTRVLKPGGLLLLGIEPNKTYFKPLKHIQKILYRLTHTDPHHISHADAKMEGFSKGQFEIVFKNGNWTDIEIRPMWFFAGWMHYMLEFIFRTFRLSKRIHVPRALEKGIVAFDELLFQIPGFSFFAWHWIVTAKKK